MTVQRIVDRAPLALGGLAWVVYVWMTAPGMYWLDSQELGAAAVQLAIPHPTGFPLFCVAGRLFAWLPFGELAWRVHLASGAAAAVAVWGVARLTLLVTRADLTGVLAAGGAALVLGASMTFWRGATVTEVYASMAAAIVISLHGLILVGRGAGPRVALPHAFFAGIAALGLHSSFRLLLLAPWLVLLALRMRRSLWPRVAPALAIVGAAAITLYLPVRSASGHAGGLDWGHPRSARALADHVTAKRIREASFSRPMLSTDPEVIGANLALVGRRTEEDLGALALVAAAAGLVALARTRQGRLPLALLATVALLDVAYAVWLNPVGIEDRQTGVPLALALAVLCGAGIDGAARALGRAAPFAAAALAVIASVQPILDAGAAKVATRSSEAPRAWAEAALAATPPGGIALVRSDSMTAGLFWLTLAEPLRPDVAAMARQHLWDLERDDAVLRLSGWPRSAPRSAKNAEGELLEGRRPVAWEIADDPEPRGAAYQPAIPMGLVGATAGKYRVRDAGLDRVFPPPSLGDPETLATAQRAYHNLGVISMRRGDTRRAIELEQRALALGIDPRYWATAARYLLAAGDDAAALAALDKAPVSAEGFALRGTLAARAGRCAQAKELLEKALALDPQEADARDNLAKIGECREK